MAKGVDIDFNANLAKFDKALTKATGDINKFSDKATKSSKRVSSAFGKMAKRLAVPIGVGGLTLLTKKSLDAADAIGKVAASTGFSISKVQELRFAADQTGVSMQAMDDVMFRFTKRLGLARTGAAGYVKVYKQLGIDISQSKDAIFNQAIDALASMEDQTTATALATRLFGDDAKKILNTFAGGTEGLEDFSEKARSLGLILSDDLVLGAEKANDQLSIMKQTVNIQFTQVFLALAPAITAMGQAFADAAPKLVTFLDSFKAIKDQGRGALKQTVESLKRDYENLGEDLRIIREKQAGNIDPTVGDLLFGIDDPDEIEARMEVIKRKFESAIKTLADLNKGPGAKEPGKFTSLPGTGTGDDDKAAKARASVLAKTQKEADRLAKAEQQRLDALKLKWDALLDPTIQFKDQLKEIDSIYEEGSDKWFEATLRVHEAMDEVINKTDELKESTGEVDEMWRDLGLTFSSAFEDAIVSGGNVRDMLKGIEQDIIRIITRKLVTEPLGNAISGLFSSGGGGAGGGISAFFEGLFKAGGGPVSAGTPYIVGERGPELFTPGRNGSITPNNQLAAASGVTINMSISTPDANSFRQSQGQVYSQAAVAVRRAQRNL